MISNEPQYSLAGVAAAACWILTALLLVLAWVAWALNSHAHLAILIAETACALSAVAAVVQIRCFSAKVCAQVRGLRSDLQESRSDVSNIRGISR